MDFRIVFAAAPVAAILSVSALPAMADVGYFFTKNSFMSEENIKSYMDLANATGAIKTVFSVDFNPLTANHVRDLKLMRESLLEFSKQATDGVILFGYSATSKFVAKLAAEVENIKALFLIDPVDGTPPFCAKKNFPVFLTNDTHISVPTWIVKSDFGTQPWTLNQTCVPKDFGADFFSKHIEAAKLKFIQIAGSGHTDFLANPVSLFLEKACKPGTLAKSEILTMAQDLFLEVVESHSSQRTVSLN
jgi:hypothetical protein